jgi:hypothetical protein
VLIRDRSLIWESVYSTMAAITLGLLVASAKTFYDTQSQELTCVSAKGHLA